MRIVINFDEDIIEDALQDHLETGLSVQAYILRAIALYAHTRRKLRERRTLNATLKLEEMELHMLRNKERATDQTLIQSAVDGFARNLE